MVRQSNDGTGTEFSHWFRENAMLYPSSRSDLPKSCDPYIEPLFTVHNLDYILRCYQGHNAGKWMLLEEKRFSSKMRFAQQEAFKPVESACLLDKNFQGFHLVQFENTTPDDGRIWLDGNNIHKDDFVQFIRFEQNKRLYLPHFKESNHKTKELIRSRIKGRKIGGHNKIGVIAPTQARLN